MLRDAGSSPEKSQKSPIDTSRVALFLGPTDRIDYERRALNRDVIDKLKFAARGTVYAAIVAGALALVGCAESDDEKVEKLAPYCLVDSARDGDGIYTVTHRLFPNIDGVAAEAVDIYVEGNPYKGDNVPLGSRVRVCVDADVADIAAGENVPEGID